MYKDGYCNIYNIDISETVIQTMAERNKEMIAMTCNTLCLLTLSYLIQKMKLWTVPISSTQLVSLMQLLIRVITRLVNSCVNISRHY